MVPENLRLFLDKRHIYINTLTKVSPLILHVNILDVCLVSEIYVWNSGDCVLSFLHKMLFTVATAAVSVDICNVIAVVGMHM